MIRAIRTIRSKWVPAVLLLSVFALAGADSQCSKVSDPLAPDDGAALRGGGRSDCMKECTRLKKEAKKAEQLLHRDNIRDCDGDPACIQAEAARHALAMLEIARDFQECREDCHNQGGGGGGQ